MYPPISIRVEKLFCIEKPSVFPKFFAFKSSEVFIFSLFCDIILAGLGEEKQFLKISPTVILPRIWEINSKTPILLLLNIAIPQVPIMNKGPEVLVNASKRDASSKVHLPSWYNSDVILAPVGYPESQPIERAKAPVPETLNKGFIIGVKSVLMILTNLVFFNKSIHMKNGNKEGITLFAQSLSALWVTSKVLDEKQTMQSIINNKTIKLITLIKSM